MLFGVATCKTLTSSFQLLLAECWSLLVSPCCTLTFIGSMFRSLFGILFLSVLFWAVSVWLPYSEMVLAFPGRKSSELLVGELPGIFWEVTYGGWWRGGGGQFVFADGDYRRRRV